MKEILDALLRMRSNLYCETKFAHCRSILGTLGHSSLWCYSSLSQHLNILLKSSSGCEDMKEVVSVILSRKFKLPTRTVVEDIGMGLAAAEVAGMKCIVTKSRYTAEEDFQNAYANFDFFGDSPEERFYLGTCGSLLSNSNSL
ncbi:unnamed protein product [Malus baccata var. baccata]